MYLKNIEIKNFRNFEILSLNFPEKGVLFYGKNAIGKTNLLESIYILSNGKSFRTNDNKRIIGFDKDFCNIKATLNFNKEDISFNFGFDKKNNKIFKIDNRPIVKISELFNYMKVIYFSPENIEIIDSSPSIRRSFLNKSISHLDHDFIRLLKRYNRILKQRNALLKQKNINLDEKKLWDNQYIEISAEIIQKRLTFIKKINPIFNAIFEKIFSECNINIKYSVKDDEDLKKYLNSQLIQKENNEILYQRTLFGPHLDDISFRINSKNAKHFASQGQKISIIIALKLALAQLLRTNEISPVLLFDDIFLELDEIRTNAVIEIVKDKHQIFVATPRMINLPNIDLKKVKIG